MWRVGTDPFERSKTHATHRWIAEPVVPDGTQRLYEGPCLSALPFEFVTLEVVPKQLPPSGIEQMPGTNEVKGGVRWTESANIKDPSKSTIVHQDVARDEVTVSHDIGRLPRKVSKPRPSPT